MLAEAKSLPLQFAGNGWDGVDAHYRSRHERDTGIRYEDWWRSICDEHRG